MTVTMNGGRGELQQGVREMRLEGCRNLNDRPNLVDSEPGPEPHIWQAIAMLGASGREESLASRRKILDAQLLFSCFILTFFFFFSFSVM